MTRRILLAAALATAAFAPSAQAGPPYCVSVTDSGGNVVQVCGITPDCVVSGSADIPFIADLCVDWP